jgi:hypothetical protein
MARRWQGRSERAGQINRSLLLLKLLPIIAAGVRAFNPDPAGDEVEPRGVDRVADALAA